MSPFTSSMADAVIAAPGSRKRTGTAASRTGSWIPVASVMSPTTNAQANVPATGRRMPPADFDLTATSAAPTSRPRANTTMRRVGFNLSAATKPTLASPYPATLAQVGFGARVSDHQQRGEDGEVRCVAIRAGYLPEQVLRLRGRQCALAQARRERCQHGVGIGHHPQGIGLTETHTGLP